MPTDPAIGMEAINQDNQVEVVDSNQLEGEESVDEGGGVSNNDRMMIKTSSGGHHQEPADRNIVEDLEQRVHELDCKLKQVKEERNQVILDNEELQEQLDMSNTAQSAGNVKLNELKNEMIKVTEDLTRLECVCTTQEHELKTLSDKLIDLNSVKETVKELNEDTKSFKEDFNRMRTHLNVAAKLELQTQEKMYESRLHHLENVLEEMRQREGHFMRLAEETSALKDQVDALRELSMMSLKGDNKGSGNSLAEEDELSKHHAAIAAANAAQYAAIMDSCSGSSMPQVLLATSPGISVRSEDNTLAKEIANAPPLLQSSNSFSGQSTGAENNNEVTEMTVEQTATAAALAAAAAAATAASSSVQNDDDDSGQERASSLGGGEKEAEEDLADPKSVASRASSAGDGTESDEGIEDDPLLSTTATDGGASLAYPLLPTEEGVNLKNQGIKVSGTLRLRSRDPLEDYREQDRRLDHVEMGCFPSCMLSVWGNLFD